MFLQPGCCMSENMPVFCSSEDVSKEKKLLFISLYFLIWGEASNVRFLPECLCYIFHHVGYLAPTSYFFFASCFILLFWQKKDWWD